MQEVADGEACRVSGAEKQSEEKRGFSEFIFR
jgi:hypothetical protein